MMHSIIIEHLGVCQAGSSLPESSQLYGSQVKSATRLKIIFIYVGLVRGAVALGLILKAPVEYEFFASNFANATLAPFSDRLS